ncbi:MAG: YnfA family protein [Proteobacteria bacterium]|nr:YnfA family protein [Pseudomonadota bacterium]
MKNYLWYLLASIGEIGGCFAFWAWLRLGKSIGWIIPGIIALSLFAIILTQVSLPAQMAGRAYAAYGGIYIISSLVWLWLIEGVQPSQWDWIGAGFCLIGMSIIFWGPRSS